METCSPPRGCKVRYSAETAEELSEILKNSQGPYLKEKDPELKEVLYRSRIHVNATRQDLYGIIIKQACYECPFRF